MSRFFISYNVTITYFLRMNNSHQYEPKIKFPIFQNKNFEKWTLWPIWKFQCPSSKTLYLFKITCNILVWATYLIILNLKVLKINTILICAKKKNQQKKESTQFILISSLIRAILLIEYWEHQYFCSMLPCLFTIHYNLSVWKKFNYILVNWIFFSLPFKMLLKWKRFPLLL